MNVFKVKFFGCTEESHSLWVLNFHFGWITVRNLDWPLTLLF